MTTRREPPARLAEVSEDEATGVIAAIYDDIRAALQVPLVNLIYRHLATLPGGLEWAWASLRPAVSDGTVARTATDLTQDLELPPVVGPPATGLPAVRLDADAQGEIRAILDAYNRANPQNLVNIWCLLALLDSDDGTTELAPTPDPTSGDAVARSPSAPALPAMIDPRDMDLQTRTLIAAVGADRRDDDRLIIPSLYRHLARWPRYLAAELTLLGSPASLAAIGTAADRLQRRARATTEALACRADSPLSRLATPVPEVRPQLRRQLATFAPTISRMIVIGALLSRSLPEVSPATA